MRQLLLATLFLAQGCIEAPPATQFPPDQNQNPDLANDMSVSDMGSVDFGESDAGEPDSAGDMTTDDMAADMAEDMAIPDPFIVQISSSFAEPTENRAFATTVPLRGSIQDARLLNFNEVALISPSELPIEIAEKVARNVGFWVKIPSQSFTENLTVTPQGHVNSLGWDGFEYVFHMNGNQQGRGSSASNPAFIVGMADAVGRVGAGAKGVGTATLNWTPSGAFTVMFWYRSTNITDRFQLLRFNQQGPVGATSFGFSLDNGIPGFDYLTQTLRVAGFEPDNEFHHLAVTYQVGQAVEFYVDGKNVGGGPSNLGFTDIYNLVVGNAAATDTVFDELWVANSALSAQEIETIYRNQLGEITISN